MTVPSPPKPTDLASAAKNLRDYYLDQLHEAFGKANVPAPAPLPENATTKEKEDAKAQAAELAKAQGALQSTFQQIGDVDRRANDAAGYAQAVALMTTTADAAGRIRDRIKVLVPETSTTSTSMSQAHINELDALSRALTALAALSPAALWQDGGE